MRYPRSMPGMVPPGGSHANAIEVEVVFDAVTFVGGLGGAEWGDIGRLDTAFRDARRAKAKM